VVEYNIEKPSLGLSSAKQEGHSSTKSHLDGFMVETLSFLNRPSQRLMVCDGLSIIAISKAIAEAYGLRHS